MSPSSCNVEKNLGVQPKTEANPPRQYLRRALPVKASHFSDCLKVPETLDACTVDQLFHRMLECYGILLCLKFSLSSP